MIHHLWALTRDGFQPPRLGAYIGIREGDQQAQLELP
jgi:hypothetical protein